MSATATGTTLRAAMPAEELELFWFSELSLLSVWQWRPPPSRTRFWGKWAEHQPFAPLAELPRRAGPGLAMSLIGLPPLGPGGNLEIGLNLPGGGGAVYEFTRGQSITPKLFRSAGLIVRWDAQKWVSVRIAAIFAEGLKPLNDVREVPAAYEAFEIPAEWTSGAPIEVLLTPLDAQRRRGPTERLVLPGQPPQVQVRFERVEGRTRSGDPTIWLQVRVSASGDALPLEVELSAFPSYSHQGVPESILLKVTDSNRPELHPMKDVGTQDRVRATIIKGPSKLLCRYTFAHIYENGTVRQVDFDVEKPLNDRRVHEYTFNQIAIPEPLPKPPASMETAGSLSESIRELEQTLPSSLPRLDGNSLASLPGAVVIGLSGAARNPDGWRNALNAIFPGSKADGTAEWEDYFLGSFLSRPHEIDLLMHDPLVLDAVRKFCVPKEGLRSLPDLLLHCLPGSGSAPRISHADQLLARPVPRAPQSPIPARDALRTHLMEADDAEIDVWLAGVVSGLSVSELWEALAIQRWRCTVSEIAELFAMLKGIKAEPLSALKDEVLSVAGDPFTAAFGQALKAESEVRDKPAAPEAVRSAWAEREKALNLAAERLSRAAAPGNTSAAEPVCDALRQRELRKAAGLLARIRNNLPRDASVAPLRGAVFCVEACWAAQAAQLKRAEEERTARAAAWLMRLLTSQKLPEWPITENAADLADSVAKLSRKWREMEGEINATPIPPQPFFPSEAYAEFRARSAAVSAFVGPGSGPVRETLDRMERCAIGSWLAGFTAVQNARNAAAKMIGNLKSAMASERAAGVWNSVEVELDSGTVNWARIKSAHESIAELEADERVWKEARRTADAAGVRMRPFDAQTLDDFARWLRNQPVAAVSGDGQELEFLDAVLNDLGVPLPADPEGAESGNWALPKRLYPLEFERLREIVAAAQGSVHFSQAIEHRRRTFCAWLAAQSGDPRIDPAPVLEWFRANPGRRADVRNLGAAWKEIRWLMLDGFTRPVGLRDLLRPKSARRWVRGRHSRELTAKLQDLAFRAGNASLLLEDTGKLEKLSADAAALKDALGWDRMKLAILRDYLKESLEGLFMQSNIAAAELPGAPGDVAELIDLICRCEAKTEQWNEAWSAVLHDAGVIEPDWRQP